jgi:hypothetical protein
MKTRTFADSNCGSPLSLRCEIATNIRFLCWCVRDSHSANLSDTATYLEGTMEACYKTLL